MENLLRKISAMPDDMSSWVSLMLLVDCQSTQSNHTQTDNSHLRTNVGKLCYQ